MDEAAAIGRLRRMIAADVEPALDEAAVRELLVIGARPDTNGINPDAAGWTGTWDLNAAAAEGWRWKAAQATADVDFTADGATINAADLHAHCMTMAAHFDQQSRSGHGSTTGRPTSGVLGVVGRGDHPGFGGRPVIVNL